jgi:quinol monooxygenase YgiN
MTRAVRLSLSSLTLIALACATPSTSGGGSPSPKKTNPEPSMKKATAIRLKTSPSTSAELGAFLVAGRDLVAQHEPQTLLWYALANQATVEERFIFDVFADQAGRDAHFNGKVAAALKEKAPTLVQGGWEKGVLANVSHYDVLAAKVPATGSKPKVTRGNLILLTAAPGKASGLERLLIKGRDIAAETEPATLYWFALKLEGATDRYAIYDLFPDEAGQAAHFAGQVAGALKAQSGELVAGGWEEGVLKNVTSLRVEAEK